MPVGLRPQVLEMLTKRRASGDRRMVERKRLLGGSHLFVASINLDKSGCVGDSVEMVGVEEGHVAGVEQPGRGGVPPTQQQLRGDVDVGDVGDAHHEVVAPEAVDGGPIAFVQDGDRIRIDVPTLGLDLLVDDDELARRREGWSPIEPRYTTGILGKYARLAQGAEKGAITNPV